MWTFRAMNTDVSVMAPDRSAAAEREIAEPIEYLFHETERRFSRFLPDSELARLNGARGPVTVSADLLALLVRARALSRETEGVFDPGIATAMQACGYDRSFLPGAFDRADGAPEVPPASIHMLDIDEARLRVTRPPHVQLDFGGFLKGLTVDRAAASAPDVVVIDAGGDLALRGAPEGEAGWTVEIEDPHDATHILGTIVVRDQAVATSAANRRRWRRGGREMHHLIDPRTRAPAQSDVIQATVIAPTAERADVMAKVAFVRGARTGARALERCGLAGVLVLRDRSLRVVGDLEVHHA